MGNSSSSSLRQQLFELPANQFDDTATMSHTSTRLPTYSEIGDFEDDNTTLGALTPIDSTGDSDTDSEEPVLSAKDARLESKLLASRYGGSLADRDIKGMMLVMGRCGSGKSSLVNTLVGGDVAEVNYGYGSATGTLIVPTRIGRTKVIMVDTPGCDDYNELGGPVCSEISAALARQYQRGVSLRGIIYLQRLPQQGARRHETSSSESILKMLRDICGDSKMLYNNTVLATTGWQSPQLDESEAAAQESELRRLWAPVLDRGATMARYYGERDSAVGITSRILGNKELPYESQQELVRKGKELAVRATLDKDISLLLQRRMRLGDDD